MGRITNDDRCLIKGLRTEKNGAKRLIKRVSEQEMVCGKYESFDFKKLTTADQLNGSKAVAVQGL